LTSCGFALVAASSFFCLPENVIFFPEGITLLLPECDFSAKLTSSHCSQK
jgi:hypothetical protein